MKLFFLKVWRAIRNRCVLCGEVRPETSENDLHSLGPYCRRHNKSLHFAQAYGASPQRIQAMLDKEK
jgi:hypothetical protein